jgi:hypothetical protein
LGYLRPRQAADGRFLGYLRTTWLAAAAFRLVEGPGAAPAARAIDALAAIKAERWRASALASMLSSFAEAELSPDVPLVGQGLDRLRSLAEPDGCWSSEDGDFYQVDVTLGALRNLLIFGAVSPPAAPAVSQAGAGR